MPQDLIAQLRDLAEEDAQPGAPFGCSLMDAADALEAQAAEIARLTAERDKLKTVMIAAAEEIAAHWDAHCDAEGYGPVNLQRRLEEGIPSEYGYTAGAFAALRAERDGLRVAAEAACDPLFACLEDSFELMGERAMQWGDHKRAEQQRMADDYERHRAAAVALRTALCAAREST